MVTSILHKDIFVISGGSLILGDLPCCPSEQKVGYN